MVGEWRELSLFAAVDEDDAQSCRELGHSICAMKHERQFKQTEPKMKQVVVFGLRGFRDVIMAMASSTQQGNSS